MTPSDRLDSLRELAETDPQKAQTAVWKWFSEYLPLNDKAGLEWLFAQGTAPESPDGDCLGFVIGLYGNLWLNALDRLVRVGQALGGIGWTGKSFDRRSGTGYNRLTPSSALPMYLGMPDYKFDVVRGELIGFHFDHKLDQSAVYPRQEVRSIVYANPDYQNPMVLPRTRDEIVEIVPNTYLGQALLNNSGKWQVVGYFTLRQPPSAVK